MHGLGNTKGVKITKIKWITSTEVLSKEFYKVLKDLKPHLNAQPGSFEQNIPLTEQNKETLASGL